MCEFKDDDRCMAAPATGFAYIFGREKPGADKLPKADAKRIAEAIANVAPYIRK